MADTVPAGTFEKELVSIVIPCFNYGHYLAGALESVRSQSYREWECLVVDDGSTDNTREVAESFAALDGRICYLRKENGGLSSARNLGIRAGRGAFFQFLDADDLLEPEKLSRQVGFLREHEEVGITYGEVRFFREAPDGATSPVDPPPSSSVPVSGHGAEVLAALLSGNIMVVNAALVRRSVFERCGAFDEGLVVLEDWEYWLRCALAEVGFAFAPFPLGGALVRWHSGSLSKNQVRMLTYHLAIRERMAALLTAGELRRINDAGALTARCALAMEEIKGGRTCEGLRQAAACLLRGRVKSFLYSLSLALLGESVLARLKGGREL